MSELGAARLKAPSMFQWVPKHIQERFSGPRRMIYWIVYLQVSQWSILVRLSLLWLAVLFFHCFFLGALLAKRRAQCYCKLKDSTRDLAFEGFAQDTA